MYKQHNVIFLLLIYLVLIPTTKIGRKEKWVFESEDSELMLNLILYACPHGGMEYVWWQTSLIRFFCDHLFAFTNGITIKNIILFLNTTSPLPAPSTETRIMHSHCGVAVDTLWLSD